MESTSLTAAIWISGTNLYDPAQCMIGCRRNTKIFEYGQGCMNWFIAYTYQIVTDKRWAFGTRVKTTWAANRTERLSGAILPYLNAQPHLLLYVP